MKTRRKILLSLMGLIGTGIVLVIVLYFSLPNIINSEIVKKKVNAYFVEKTGGSIAFEKSDISLLPLPHIVITQVSFTIPKKATGFVQSLDIYPDVWSLVRGDLHFSKLSLESPRFTVALSEDMEKTSLEEIEEKIRSFVHDLTSLAPDLLLTVQEGKLDLTKADRLAFSFDAIQSKLTASAKSLNISLTCRSNLWDTLSFDTSLHAEDLKSNGTVQVNHLRPHDLFAQLFPKTAGHIGDSEADLSVKFQTQGLRQIQAEVTSSIPSLSLARGQDSIKIKDLNFKGDIEVKPTGVSVQFSEFNSAYPDVKISGKYTLDQTSGIMELDLEGKSIDVQSTRRAALSLGGDIPVIRNIFDIMQGGRIPFLHFHTGGKSPDSPGQLENIQISGNLVGGDIYIRARDLTFHNVSGDVVVEKGILAGKNIEASIEKHRASKGKLRIGLKGKDAPFHLDMWVKADMAELPSLLKQKHLITNEAVLREMDRLSDSRGEVQGKLILGDRLNSIHALIDVSQMNLAARYEPLPFPLMITSGQVFFDEKSIKATNLNGNLGNSSFSQLTGQMELTDSPVLEITNGQMRISADEIFPWITSFEKIKPVLKDLPSVKGTVAVSSITLQGSLYQPEEWKYLVNGELNKFTLDATFLPGKAEEMSGMFTITRDDLSLKNIRTKMVDSLLTVSGNFRKFPADISAIDLSLQGEVGPEVTSWVSRLIDLPTEMQLRPPLTVRDATVSWGKDTRTSFDGRLVFGTETAVSLKLTKTRDELSVHEISVKDRDTDVTANAMLNKKTIDMVFKGILASSTFKTIFANSTFSDSSLQGDFRTHILLKDPRQSSAEGVIKGQNISIPWGYDIPLVVQNIVLETQKNSILVDTAQLLLGGNTFMVKGTMDTSPAWFSVDMDIASDGFDWETVENIVRGTKNAKDSKDSKEDGFLENFPLKGTLRLQLDSFKYRQFTWEPLHADVSFDGETIRIRSKKAALCGISTTGDVDITAQGAELDIKLSAKNLQLQPTILCISDKKSDITGRFEMTANLKAKGKLDTIAKSLNGSFTISAKKGEILKSKSLDKTLDLVNKTENVKGKLPDLDKTKIKYRVFTARGTIKEHIIEVEQSTLDDSSFGLLAQGKVDLYDQTVDLNALVAPLNFAQSFVGKIPVLGHLMGGSIVSIPVKIKGNLSDPQVTFLSASAIGSAFLGIMERTLKLPITIIEPILPAKK
jgi:hypothetical protein